jgi:hypothetical protein
MVGARDGFDEHEKEVDDEVEQNLLCKVDAMQVEPTPWLQG